MSSRKEHFVSEQSRWITLRQVVVGGFQAMVAVVGSPVLRRWYNRWGATDAELARPLAGDGLVTAPKLGDTRAVTIDIHSVDRIVSDHQQLVPGDIVRSGQDHHICWIVMDVDPPRHLVVQGAGTPAAVEVPEIVDEVPDRGYAASTWQWVLEPLAGGRRTRMMVRQRCTYSPRQVVLWRIVEPLNFVMEREMLRGMKARAERTYAAS